MNIQPVIKTDEAPMALAVSKLTSPIGPAPQINTVLPIRTPAL